MRIAIMQPYFLPYIGYFQLIKAVDQFVIYDNIEFTKKGWINRNRILVDKKADYFTIPLKKDSDFLKVNQRFLSDSFSSEKIKILGRISHLYKKAPEFDLIYPMVAHVFNNSETNLFYFILNALREINTYLEIQTKITISSEIVIDHSLKSENKVIAICKALSATEYYNSIGGLELYSQSTFQENQLNLHFIKPNPIVYQQFQDEFIPWLSILDVLFFNSKEKVQEFLSQYTIL